MTGTCSPERRLMYFGSANGLGLAGDTALYGSSVASPKEISGTEALGVLPDASMSESAL